MHSGSGRENGGLCESRRAGQEDTAPLVLRSRKMGILKGKIL